VIYRVASGCCVW